MMEQNNKMQGIFEEIDEANYIFEEFNENTNNIPEKSYILDIIDKSIKHLVTLREDIENMGIEMRKKPLLTVEDKLAFLKRAEELNSVSKACSEYGVSYTTHAKYKEVLTKYGIDGLRDKRCKK